ncbi:MAG: HlyC/CorC family transporter [Nocardioidaceae bacterium]|nr:HlyC/CorC family transporter [Nocardioidaceae bacterium]
MTEWLLLLLAFLLVLACGVCVAAEFSFVTVDRSVVDRAVEQGQAGAAGVQKALSTLSTQLSGAQLGITLTNLAIGFLAEPALAALLRGPLTDLGLPDGAVRPTALALALFLSTMVTMMLGELVPKNLAIAAPMATARATQAPQRAFTKSMALLIRNLNGTANRVLHRLGVEPQEELRSTRSPEELASLVRRSAQEGVLHGTTASLVARSIAFGERTAADVKTPRVRVRYVEEREPVLAVIEAARETGHSRFPVIGRGLDDVVGVVHVKQAVAIDFDRRRSTRVGTVCSPATIVPASIELDPLLVQLREQRMQMAVVVDEYGGNDGVVTLEDLVEELVGDIADEFDRDPSSSRQRSDGGWSLSGLLRPDEIAENTGLALVEHDDYETVAGLVVQQLGRLARTGDEIVVDATKPGEHDGATASGQVRVSIAVERTEGRRVDRVLLREVHPDDAPDRAGTGAGEEPT